MGAEIKVRRYDYHGFFGEDGVYGELVLINLLSAGDERIITHISLDLCRYAARSAGEARRSPT